MANNTFTDYKGIIISKLIENTNLLKALTINQPDFLNPPLTIDPTDAVYNYIFPYKGQKEIATGEKCILTMQFKGFEPKDETYIEGDIYFYIVCSNTLVRTDYGNRYDYIYEQLKTMFYKSRELGIGRAKLKLVSDLEINENYMGSYCVFHVSDFIKVSSNG
jgi:hypothetical protein